MTPEAQRIAIAEACGWENVHSVIVKNVTKKGDDRFCGITSSSGWIPDYLNDLNAMLEAEMRLIPYMTDLDRNWRDNLEAICRTMGGMLHATATQRAEALLRTIGKWEGP